MVLFFVLLEDRRERAAQPVPLPLAEVKWQGEDDPLEFYLWMTTEPVQGSEESQHPEAAVVQPPAKAQEEALPLSDVEWEEDDFFALLLLSLEEQDSTPSVEEAAGAEITGGEAADDKRGEEVSESLAEGEPAGEKMAAEVPAPAEVTAVEEAPAAPEVAAESPPAADGTPLPSADAEPSEPVPAEEMDGPAPEEAGARVVESGAGEEGAAEGGEVGEEMAVPPVWNPYLVYPYPPYPPYPPPAVVDPFYPWGPPGPWWWW